MINDALTYGYSNARIRSLSGQLLDHGALERLIRADTDDAAVAALAESSYAPELSEMSLQYKGVELVDFAITRNFSRICRKILNMTPSASKAVVEALFSKWDIQDIKTILLGKHLGRPKSEMSRLLMVAGTLTSAELDTIMDAEGVAAAIKHLGATSYGRALMPHLIEYERLRDINPLIWELDKLYLMRLVEAVYETEDRLVKALLMADADAKNIMTILRCRVDGSMDPDKVRLLLVPAGNMTASELDALLSSKEWQPMLARHGEFGLSAALEAYELDKSLTHIEHSLEDYLMRHATRTFRMSVLSLGVIVGFVYIKEDELRRIQRIMHGKEYGLSADRIRQTVSGVYQNA